MEERSVNQTGPLVSIVTPIYRCGNVLADTVASVQAQTMPDWELLLVDDCSGDGTYAVAEALAREDSRIVLLQTERNLGPAGSRNMALDRARGKYLAFLDGDDLWKPEKLEKQIAFMRQTGAHFSCTAYDRVAGDGKTVLGRVTPFPKADYKKVLYYANPVGNSTVLLERDTLGDTRIPEIRKRNDFALWLAVLKKTDYVYGMQECLGCYRLQEGSVSSKKLDLLKYQWQLYTKVEKLNALQVAGAFAGLCYIKAFHPTWH